MIIGPNKETWWFGVTSGESSMLKKTPDLVCDPDKRKQKQGRRNEVKLTHIDAGKRCRASTAWGELPIDIVPLILTNYSPTGACNHPMTTCTNQ